MSHNILVLLHIAVVNCTHITYTAKYRCSKYTWQCVCIGTYYLTIDVVILFPSVVYLPGITGSTRCPYNVHLRVYKSNVYTLYNSKHKNFYSSGITNTCVKSHSKKISICHWIKRKNIAPQYI